jgi:N-acetylmuramoyl-L-alanine amidase
MFLFLMVTVTIFVAFTPNYSKPSIKKIVIDAGHGGSDPGNLGTGRYKITEKDVTLDVAKQLGKYITDQFPEIEIVYTRKDDSYPTLNKRVEIANNSNADLFISVHCDAFTKPTAKGSSSFVMGMHKTEESLRVAMKENASIYREENYQQNYSFDPGDPDTYIALTLRQNAYLDNSLLLSQKIQDQFRTRVGRVDRGVRQAGYFVICYTTMPSVLVELGFLTNEEEEDFLNSKDGRGYMASALFRAFKEYKTEIEGEGSGEETTVQHPTPVEKPKEEPKPKEVVPVDTKWTEKIKHHDVSGIHYQVQIVTSSTRLTIKPENFNGLVKVDEYIRDGIYKYAAGKTTDFEEARDMQRILRENGFPGAFVIAFRDKERIVIAEALKSNPK